MRPLRVGLIGASRIAKMAIIDAALQIDQVEVVAVASRDLARARLYADEHGIARAYGDYAALLRDPDIDLVYIATPPSHHAEHALAAIAAGKPALVEKPFALTTMEAHKIYEAAAAAGVRVFEAMHSPHHRLFARVLEIVHSGMIGAPRHIEAMFEAPIERSNAIRWTAELGGGALMDLGVYPLAWGRRIGGERFVVRDADAEVQGGVDARFAAALEFETGPTCRIAASMIADKPAARLQIEGDRGSVDVLNPVLPQLGNKLILVSEGKEQTESVDGPSSFEAQLVAVEAALRRDLAFPFPSDDFVASMIAIERVRSAFA